MLAGTVFNARGAEWARDKALASYGAVLGLAHALMAVHWTLTRHFPRVLSQGEPICWPFWEGCERARVLGERAISAIFGAYFCLGVAATWFFVRSLRASDLNASSKDARRAGIVLAVAAGVFALSWVQDFRFRQSQHTTLAWQTAVFLAVPRARAVLKGLVVLSYAWASTLKFHVEWLSGAALYGNLWMPQALVPAACAYVVFLELCVSWALLSKRRWLFWGAFAQFAAFHVMSFAVIEYSYPLLMLGVLWLFVADRRWPEPPGPRSKRTRAAVWGTFSACQLVPYAFPGDVALTGEGRLVAQHMFDAHAVCERRVTVHRTTGVTRFPIPSPDLQPRIVCDPLLLMTQVKHLCEQLKRDPEFRDLDAFLASRRKTSTKMTTVVDAKGVCSTPLTYDVFRHNPWILPERDEVIGRVRVGP